MAESGLPPTHFDRYHIDAMIVANRINLPTFFGYSGWTPIGYPVRTPVELNAEFYDSLQKWSNLEKFRGVVAIFDMKEKKWIRYPLTPQRP